MPKISSYPVASTVPAGSLVLVDTPVGAGTYQTRGATVSTLATAVSPGVYVASLNGVPVNASLSNPAVGTDGSTALQTLIDLVYANGGGTIVIDGPIKCHDVKLRANITLEGVTAPAVWTGGGPVPAVGLIQSPASQCCLRNYNWTSAYNSGSPVTDFSTIVDQNITIRNLFINGNRGTGTVNNACGGNANINVTGLADAYANPGVMYITTCAFFGVRNLMLENVTFYDPGYQSFAGAYLDGFSLRNISIFCPAVYAGIATPTTITSAATGIIVSGSSRNGLVQNAQGYCGGNIVSIFADAFPTNTSGATVPTAYYAALYPGPVSDVEVVGVHTPLSENLVSIWSGNKSVDNVTTFNSLITRVSAHGFSGTFYGQNVIGFDGPSSVIGTHGDEQVYNGSIKVVQGPNNFRGAFAEGNHVRLSFKNLYFDVSGVTGWDAVSAIGNAVFWFNPGSASQLLELDEISIYSTSTIAFDCVQGVGGGGPRTRLSNFSAYRTQTAAGAVFHCSGAGTVVTELQLSGVLANGMSNIVLFDVAGTLSNVTTTNLVHLNANGGASIQVTTVTLPRLRSAASNTALLYATASGGAITSNKNDGTQDSP